MRLPFCIVLLCAACGIAPATPADATFEYIVGGSVSASKLVVTRVDGVVRSTFNAPYMDAEQRVRYDAGRTLALSTAVRTPLYSFDCVHEPPVELMRTLLQSGAQWTSRWTSERCTGVVHVAVGPREGEDTWRLRRTIVLREARASLVIEQDARYSPSIAADQAVDERVRLQVNSVVVEEQRRLVLVR